VRLQLFALAYNLELPAHPAAARCGGAVVAHDATREAGQDRRADRAPPPLRRLPIGRGGRAPSAVRRSPAADRPAARAARAGGVTRRNGAGAEAEGGAMRRRTASGHRSGPNPPLAWGSAAFPPEIRHPLRARIDRPPPRAHPDPCRPRRFGESRVVMRGGCGQHLLGMHLPFVSWAAMENGNP
jgi:hypothetical protein